MNHKLDDLAKQPPTQVAKQKSKYKADLEALSGEVGEIVIILH